MHTLSFLLLLAPLCGHAQTAPEVENSPVHWLTMEKLQDTLKVAPRPVMVDLYTQWCGPCKKLAAETFTDPGIADYLNSHFYTVRFDAQSGDPVQYKGKRYENPDFDPAKVGVRNSTHQLTYELDNTNGQIAFPTLVYMDGELRPIIATQGFYTPEKLEPKLVYYGEGAYKTTTFEDFLTTFKSSRTTP